MSMMSIVFSNVYDENLKELTATRTMGSLPILSRYRLIDFVLSNCVNSGIRNVGVITKMNYQSLMDHLGNGKEWDFDCKAGGLFILPPFGNRNAFMYRGKLEALYGALRYLKRSTDDYVLLSDSNIICSIDYRKVLKHHLSHHADITVVAQQQMITANDQNDKNLILEKDENNRVTDVKVNCFTEKSGLCSLNMYLINRNLLIRLVEEAHTYSQVNLEKSLIQNKYDTLHISVYEYLDYTAKIDSIQSYFLKSMEFLKPEVRRQVFHSDWPIYTKVLDEPPVFYSSQARVSRSLVADGCVIEGNVINSILFRGVRVKPGACIRNSIVMQNTVIEENSTIEYTIVDKDAVITENKLLVGIDRYPVVIQKGTIA
ncbi:MAG: glucose-1-phosphate adenylyltransferase subunit GlgD [Massiliimalia sp.]|jgi:glucose-1-phosphate adenylyltransferase